MNDEASWIAGHRAAFCQVASLCARELGGHDGDYVEVLSGRGRIVAALRRLSEDLGCNDWPDNLDLVDVIEKYIGRSIETRKP